jgi:N-acetylglucosaminyl-diphospho-decaprenol L-rhamnosyltransferase
VELSYCVTNTNARESALACVEAIKRANPDGLEHEIIVLDNASQDGSADTLALVDGVRVLKRDRRGGASSNRTLLMREARGELCMLLDEDAELQPGSVEALVAALRANPKAAVAGPQLVYPDGAESPCAWRLPGVGTALAQLLFLGGALVTQSGKGEAVRAAGWVQSAAMLVRRAAAEEIGWWDPAFFLYSDETDFEKRLHDAGWTILHVPAGRAIHREQLSANAEAVSAGARRRIVQFHRGRDLYMRKHHSLPAVYVSRVLWSLSYLPRALAAAVRPGVSARRYWLHARQALRPAHGGADIQDVAEAFNRRLTDAAASTR